MKNQQTITLLLSDYVKYHLGNGYWSERAISKELALTIFSLTRNEHTCHIQFADQDGRPLDEPILWNYSHWKESLENWNRQKTYSHKMRVERFLFDDNTKTIAKAWVEYSASSDEAAHVLARKLLTKNNISAIRVFFVGLIKTKEEEL